MKTLSDETAVIPLHLVPLDMSQENTEVQLLHFYSTHSLMVRKK